MKKLPDFLRKYFWEVKFEDINFDKRKIYILKRILEYGDTKAVKWMWTNFKKDEIKDALCNYRGYSKKTANFWAKILGIDKENVKCLSKSFQEIQSQFWPY